MIKYFLIAIFSGVLSAVSQVLLKKSAEKKRASLIGEYMNPYVAGGYLLTGICMLLMIIAYRGIPYKYGAILESLVYVYIMILSKMFLGEKITEKKLTGNILIVIGVIVFGLGSR